MDDDRLGTLEETPDGVRLRFVRRLAHPREKVWRALTDDEHLAAWFPQRVVGDRVAGSALTFEFPGGEAPSFTGRVLVAEPPAVLELSWGTDVLRFELAEADGGAHTVLTLLDTLADRGTGARTAAGWHACLDALEAHLDAAAPVDVGAVWSAVHPGYVDRLGAAAASVGPPPGTAPR